MIGRILRAVRRELRGVSDGGEVLPCPRQRPVPSVPSGALLAGKRALIVGAGPNIGRGVARMLAGAGANLVLTDSRAEPLEQLQHELRELSVNVRTEVSDVANAGSTDELLRRLEADGQVPDVLVLNAALPGEAMTIGAARFEDMERLFRTNVFGLWYLADQLAAVLARQQRGGSFVFITSIHQHTVRGIPAYSASKAALGMLVRELALQYAPVGIRVNAVAPGWVALDEQQEVPSHRQTPLHTGAVDPDYIGAAVLHLAADALAGHTTGASLTVDGGLSLHSYLTVPRG